ncbi:DUF3710 domain-containing protein [Nocardioides sp. 616]|uniref:DUF3710 domain-containing protein n=1 Tax=Nocardioides sp. 616 TaxID=2268090 RepID=UPI000CE2EC8E|nr:DUF3710 domain-containing protein [Nocardioides sp. 616]
MKFRRKSEAAAEPQHAAQAPQEPGEAGDTSDSQPTAGSGPYDLSEVHDDLERVDLGALLLAPAPGFELRLQVNEETGAVQSVMMAGPDGAMEFQVFSAPRNGDLWSDVRPQIAEDIARRGGSSVEREGRFGTELVCQMPVKREDGTDAVQPSRIIGINGARWFLRVSLLGRPAVEPESAQDWEDALALVAVRRGDQAMPVGRPLPFVLPDNARRAQ